jgi:hypothetical protein
MLRDRFGLAAFATYLALSALIFGRGLIGHLADYHIGVDIPADSTIFIWSMAWWRQHWNYGLLRGAETLDREIP